MALFKNEAEKNVGPESSMKPQSPPSQGVSVPSAPAAAAKIVLPRQAAHEGRTYLAHDCRVSGKLNFDGPAQIDGQIDGEIAAKDSIVIGEGAVVTAQITAASIVVAGIVKGEVTASQRIEIRPSARVMGNVISPVLVVHEGAAFEGHCAVQSHGAREDRKVTVLPKEDRTAPHSGESQRQAS